MRFQGHRLPLYHITADKGDSPILSIQIRGKTTIPKNEKAEIRSNSLFPGIVQKSLVATVRKLDSARHSGNVKGGDFFGHD